MRLGGEYKFAFDVAYVVSAIFPNFLQGPSRLKAINVYKVRYIAAPLVCSSLM